MRVLACVLCVSLWALLSACSSAGPTSSPADDATGELTIPVALPGTALERIPLPPAAALAPRHAQQTTHTFASDDVWDSLGASWTDTELHLQTTELTWAILGVSCEIGQKPSDLHLNGTSDGTYFAVSNYERGCWQWVAWDRTDSCSVELPATGLLSGTNSFYVAAVCPDTHAADYVISVDLTAAGADESWNMLVWLAGDNEQAEDAYQIIQQLEDIGSSDQINILIGYELDPLYLQGEYSGVTQVHFMQVVTDTNPQAINVDGHPANEAQSRQKYDSSFPNNVRLFLEWAETNFTADRQMLILYGPGDGWREECGG